MQSTARRPPTPALAALLAMAMFPSAVRADEPPAFDVLAGAYAKVVRPIVGRYCLTCHSTESKEGELDLERFATLADVRRSVATWQKVAEQLDTGEMPPEEARQPAPETKRALRGWIAAYLDAEALAADGDPGPVVLRRLNNAEYTYTVRDLTGVDLDPAREFPADGAAGEGFTNAGAALAMSPALLSKYLDAAKGIAAHAVPLPDGLAFSAGTTRRDWADERLAAIRQYYARFADPEGRLPIADYLKATIEERDGLGSGATTPAAVAARRNLNGRYLATLRAALTDPTRSPLLDGLRDRWRAATPADAVALAAEIAGRQAELNRIQNVGHLKTRVVPVDPLAARREVRLAIPEGSAGDDITIVLEAGDAGDGSADDLLVWENPRLRIPGRPDLPLADVRAFLHDLDARKRRVFGGTAAALEAAAAALARRPELEPELAPDHGGNAEALASWLDFLGIGAGPTIPPDLLRDRLADVAGLAFVSGWGSPETPSLVANASDQHVRIPGNLGPKAVAVHPSPTRNVAVGWLSPIAGPIRVTGRLIHAHPECGNGVTWALELRRGGLRARLASGVSAGAKPVPSGPIEGLPIRRGDLIVLTVGPRDGNHACDLTDVALTIEGDGRTWDLSADLTPDVTAANPHADRQGHPGVWHLFTEPAVAESADPAIPAGSLLARWLATSDAGERRPLGQAIQALLLDGPPSEKGHPDARLYRRLVSPAGPLFAEMGRKAPPAPVDAPASTWGLDPALFGRHPEGMGLDGQILAVKAPSALTVRLPAGIFAGCELVTTAALDRAAGGEASVQARVRIGSLEPASLATLLPDTPVLAAEGGAARDRFGRAFDEFRRLFPAALCYPKIVPVDEAVTLALYHREDEPLKRLMLDDDQTTALDRLWSELHFVAEDALTQVDAFTQLMEYATQDGDPRLFEPYRQPILDLAAAYRRERVEAEPRQLDALLAFAEKAYRRPLAAGESGDLRALYLRLRDQEIPHDEALRLTLARVLVAPAFLYKIETPDAGAAPSPVSDWELACRLSYFLWSSLPDDELRGLAGEGRIRDPEVLAAQARRMLSDEKAGRLASEFALQWMHLYDFERADEKSERHFPTFTALRPSMREEVVRFFADLFRRDGTVVSILDADHTFLNGRLAEHYGVPDVAGDAWRRVEGVRASGRGGVLGFAATLAKQSGASRTSPILRGNWVAEVLLGDRLPRPPKDVPPLPDEAGEDHTQTVRQLVERHTRDPRCAGCHARIDPFGHALERYDAIGRLRDVEPGVLPIDARVKAPDGREFEGLEGLRRYLATDRREAFVRQFCRKLLGYALGRGVQLSDGPLLEAMRRGLEAGDGRVSAAVEAIVRSRQFREIRGRDAADDSAILSMIHHFPSRTR